MTTTFGHYRGAQTYLMHIARNDEDDVQLPMICKMKFPIAAHYSEFLSRKVQDGFKTETLLLGVNNVSGWVRNQNTGTYRIKRHRLMEILDNFKRVVRRRTAMRKIRQRRRAQRIHEELVSIVWSPAALQKRLDMGLTLDEVLDL
jgi:hypothetical protein